MRPLRIAACVALFASSVVLFAGPAHATFGGSNGLIAWTRPFFLTDSEIYVMNPDGTGMRPLTNNRSNDADPAWSPDGSQVAFESVTGDVFDLYVVQADGSGWYQVTDEVNRTDVQPSWSPDGTTLVFSRQKMDGTGSISLVSATGGAITPLTNEQRFNAHPVWSPDGSTILWESDRSGNHDLWLMNADGSNQRNLTNTPDVQESNPNWSPDGTKIAFDSCTATSWPCPGGSVDYNVFVMNADGSGVIQLTFSPKIDLNPAWSPDMRKIVYRSDASGNTEVWKMNADGSAKRKLTGGLQGGVDPDWQPIP